MIEWIKLGKMAEDIRKTGYDCGYADGLIDAWQCLSKIVKFGEADDWSAFFDYMSASNYIEIFTKYSVPEAIAKIKEYEEIKEG